MKFVILIFFCLLCSACVEKRNSTLDKNRTETQMKFLSEINTIFAEIKFEDLTFYNTAGAEYVMLEIKSENMNLQVFNMLKNTKIKDEGWEYLKNENQSIIFCKKNSQLEISAPKKIIGNDELQDGDILRQLDNEWNIVFYKPKKIITSCSK